MFISFQHNYTLRVFDKVTEQRVSIETMIIIVDFAIAPDQCLDLVPLLFTFLVYILPDSGNAVSKLVIYLYTSSERANGFAWGCVPRNRTSISYALIGIPLISMIMYPLPRII